jgi:release factor glutamine methyltransferase
VSAPTGGAGRPGWDALVAASGLPRLDARALAEHASGRPRAWLIAHGDEPVEPGAAEAFAALAARRQAGEPLAYLLGWREFRGRRFAVSPAVLVPRPETECLVDAALARLPAGRAPRVLDLGTGSGAIAVSIELERPDAEVVATDASAEALAVARANAASLGAARVAFRAGDWWGALPADTPPFDLVVSNPPYVADADPHLLDPALRREPRAALASGPDGLDAIDAIVAGAPSRLAPGGWLLLEHGRDQGAAVRARLAAAGFADVATLPDLQGLDRVGLGRRADRGFPRSG